MKIYNIVFAFLIILGSCNSKNNKESCDSTTKETTQSFRYTNPLTRDTMISMRDHCIIKVDDKWYCTGTSNPVWTGLNPGVRLLVSND